MSIEILDCLKRKRDICIKNIIPSQNTAFGFTPALTKLKSYKNFGKLTFDITWIRDSLSNYNLWKVKFDIAEIE